MVTPIGHRQLKKRRESGGLKAGEGREGDVTAFTNGRGDEALMRNGRTGDRENPLLGHATIEREGMIGTVQRITSGPAVSGRTHRPNT